MRESRLLLILDTAMIKEGRILSVAETAIKSGVSFIQLRDKISDDRALLGKARALRSLTVDNGCVLIINDRVDIALAAGADGVHIGQDDLPINHARAILGDERIIGVSTHTINQAIAAQAEGADYIGVGPVFKTSTKPGLEAIGLDIVLRVAEEIDIPAFFIGGINASNIEEINARGGRRVAVASAILKSEDIVTALTAVMV